MSGKIVKYASTRFGIVRRSKGQSAIDHASYISRSVIVSEYDGQTYRPKYHEDLVHCEVNLPENAPEEWKDRAVLWNSVEMNEKAKNAQLARTMKASLPNDWSYELAEEVVRDFVRRNFVSKGMCADWAIHDSVNPQGVRNLHFHLMLTLRPVGENGKWGAKQRKEYILDKDGNKIRNKSGRGFKSRAVDVNDWNDKGNSKKWRKDLADTINAVNERAGVAEHWEHRSFKELGTERQPTIHLGPIASALERKGVRTERGDINRAITEQNRILLAARREYARAEVAMRQLAQAEQEQAAQKEQGEVAWLLDRIMEQKGKLYLPLVGAPNFHKAPHRDVLTNAGSVKQFLEDEGIGSFAELEDYAEKAEQARRKSNQSYQSKATKLRQLKELAEMFIEYEPYMEVLKKYRGMGGLKAARFHAQHREELEREKELRDRILSRLNPGEKMMPKKWDGEIKKLTADCRALAKESGEKTFRLAFVEVIRYNRRMFEAEQEKIMQGREPNQRQNRQESQERQKTQDREPNRQEPQEQRKQNRRKKGMEL